MSSYSAREMAGRVVVVHDMDDSTAVSELDVDQAAILIEQMQAAMSQALKTLGSRQVEGAVF